MWSEIALTLRMINSRLDNLETHNTHRTNTYQPVRQALPRQHAEPSDNCTYGTETNQTGLDLRKQNTLTHDLHRDRVDAHRFDAPRFDGPLMDLQTRGPQPRTQTHIDSTGLGMPLRDLWSNKPQRPTLDRNHIDVTTGHRPQTYYNEVTTGHYPQTHYSDVTAGRLPRTVTANMYTKPSTHMNAPGPHKRPLLELPSRNGQGPVLYQTNAVRNETCRRINDSNTHWVERPTQKQQPTLPNTVANRHTAYLRPQHGPNLQQKVNSTNYQFQSLTKCFMQTVQIKQHTNNWKQFPRSLDQRLEEFFNDITPPLPSDALAQALTEIRHETMTNIIGLVNNHLSGSLDKIRTNLTLLCPVDKELAASVAREALLKKRTWPKPLLDTWLKQELDLMDQELTLRLAPIPDPPLVVPMTEPVTMGPTVPTSQPRINTPLTENLLRRTPPIRTSGGRTDASPMAPRVVGLLPHPLPTTNRFDMLLDLAEEDFPPLAQTIVPETPMRRRRDPEIEDSSSSSDDPPIRTQVESRKRLARRRVDTQPKLQAVLTPVKATASHVHTVTIADPPMEWVATVVDDETLKWLNKPTAEKPLAQPSVLPPSYTSALAEVERVLLEEAGTAQTNVVRTLPDEVEPELVVPIATETQSTWTMGGQSQDIKLQVTVHTPPKDKWSLATDKNKAVVLVGDSQLRVATEFPSQWDVHCFPGMALIDCYTLLRTAVGLRNSKQTLVLLIGINNRNRAEHTNAAELSKLLNALRNLNLQFYIAGVSHGELTLQETRALETLNELIQHSVKTQEYIHPLNTSLMQTSHDTHLTRESVNRILASIDSHMDLN